VSNTVAEEDPEARRAEEHREEEDAKLDAGEPEEDDGRPYTARSRRRSTGHERGGAERKPDGEHLTTTISKPTAVDELPASASAP
jgi:hypothetical protein